METLEDWKEISNDLLETQFNYQKSINDLKKKNMKAFRKFSLTFRCAGNVRKNSFDHLEQMDWAGLLRTKFECTRTF